MAQKKFLNFTEFINEKYSYVNEDDMTGGDGTKTGTGTPAQPLTINLTEDFESGKWKISPEIAQKMTTQLAPIDAFIKANPTSTKITVSAGESKVPNRDAEAPVGADGQHPTLPQGQLAQNRMKAVSDFINQYLQSKGIDKNSVQIASSQPVIGGPDWKPGTPNNLPEFTQAQFVKLTVEASVANQAQSPLATYALNGESIFYQNKIFGTLHYKSAANGQAVNTAGQDAILRLVNPNTGAFTNQYVEIPANQTQVDFGTTNTVQSDEIVKQLTSATKPVPQNDPFFGKTVSQMSNTLAKGAPRY